MDMMLLGETLTSSDSGETSLGFWMPAGGNDGVAGVEVFFQSVPNAAEVYMDTKRSDEADSAATPIGSVVLTSTTPQTYKFDTTDAKDLVRYRVESLDRNVFIHIQFAQPLWQPN